MVKEEEKGKGKARASELFHPENKKTLLGFGGREQGRGVDKGSKNTTHTQGVSASFVLVTKTTVERVRS